MMGPPFLIDLLQKHLQVEENCTGRIFPTLGFAVKLRDGQEHTLTLDAEDYMDREAGDDGEEYCWAHLAPMAGTTGRGPVLVLGMPFLRKFYTVFDADKGVVGFGLARQPAESATGPKDVMVNGTFRMAGEESFPAKLPVADVAVSAAESALLGPHNET